MSKELFDLPEGWSWQPLSALAEIVSGGTPSREVAEYWSPAEIAWVTPTDITGSDGRHLISSKEHISKSGLQKSSAAMLPVGTVLMTSRATLGQAKISAVECCTNQGFKSLVPKSGVPSEYLYYLVQLFKTRYEQLGIGSTFLEVSKKDTEKFMLPVAPEGQRSSIAKILGCVDNQIDATQALIDKYTAIKQGMMADLFSRGIDLETKALRPTFEEAPELYHETPLGMLPKGWFSFSLQEIAAEEKGSTVIGPFGSDLVAADYTSEGVPIVFVRDVKVDRFIWKSNTYVSQAKARALKAHSAQPGDVIVTKMGLPPCIAAVYPDSMPNGIITADIIRLRPNDALAYSDWVVIAINSNEMIKQVEAITAGVTRPKVTLKDFRQLIGRFPPKKEQKLILDRLEPIKSLIAFEEAALAKLKLQKQGLMQDLLTGKVPVPA